MNTNRHERGQALILIVFAMIGLFGITALAVDGGMAYSDRRSAQNAADSAALAAALADLRGRDLTNTAMNTAAIDGFDDNQTTNWVTVSPADSPSGSCSNTPAGKDITVQITSVLNTYFGPVIGIRQVKNTVTATARACEPYTGPLFPGNAIIALGQHGIGFDANGNVDWSITGGGIFSNSATNPSARCDGSTNIIAPSLTTVGDPSMRCSSSASETTGARQLSYSDYESLLPRAPACDGVAKKVGGLWVAQQGADGSQVQWNGDMQFGPGVYCVTNSPGTYHNKITGSGVTFYLVPTDFKIKFNGGGGGGGGCGGTGTNAGLGAPLTPSTSGEYAGILIFSAAHLSGGELQQTQEIDLRGNGSGNISGSIIVPSASVTMFGNSGGVGNQTQIIAFNVDSGGCAKININYNAKGGYQAQYPALLSLLR